MVYCGKLSKACLACRKRRISCDLARNGCGQCSRARIQCAGYRGGNDIRFRDETAIVQQKAAHQANQTAPKLRSIDISICHQAKDVFYQTYVLGDTKSYNFMGHYYAASAIDAHLQASIEAVSLAYLNYQKHHALVKADARIKYAKALNLTTKVIQDPELAIKNSTLLSILLLDLYEKITNHQPRYDDAWAAHLEGALALVKLRGQEQCHDAESLGLLTRITTNVLISCITSDRTVPQDVADLLYTLSTTLVDRNDPRREEWALGVESALLRSRIKQNIFSDEEIVRSAVDLEARFSILADRMTSTGAQTRIDVLQKSRHHYEMYHFLSTKDRISQMANVVRMTRIMICERILVHSHDDTLRANAISTIDDLSREICATVPENIGDPTARFGGSSITTVGDAKQFLPCYSLIFPLYIAAKSPNAPPELQVYVIKELRFMADCHGIENALRVAKILEMNVKLNDWHVYTMLGSYAFVC